MKVFIFSAILLMAATSCSNESESTVVENNPSHATAPVTVRFNDFSVNQDDFPSGSSTHRAAQNVVNYSGVGVVTLAFYADEVEMYKTTQLRTDHTTYTTFGEFTCNLPIGTYTLVAVARGYSEGDEFTLTSPTVAAYASERPRETFVATQNVTVASATPLDLSVTLSRISAKLNVNSTDGRPANATKIRTTFSGGGKSFNPTTGLTLNNGGFTQTNNPKTAVNSSIDVGLFPLLHTDEQTMTVTIEALDADNQVLISKVVPDVPFKRNKVTTLRGAVFTPSTSSAALKVETDWLTETIINF